MTLLISISFKKSKKKEGGAKSNAQRAKKEITNERGIISSGYASQMQTCLGVNNSNNQWLQLSIIQLVGHVWK